MEKAVSPVVSTVLLVLIVVLLSSLSYSLLFVNTDKRGNNIGVTFDQTSKFLEMDVVKYESNNITIVTKNKRFEVRKVSGGDKIRLYNVGERISLVNEEDTLVRTYKTNDKPSGIPRVESSNAKIVDEFLLKAQDDTSGAKTQHRIDFATEQSDIVGSSLNSVQIEYPSSFDVTELVSECKKKSDGSSPPCPDLIDAGIDEDFDGEIERNADFDVECCPGDDGVISKDSGSTLRIEFSGNVNIKKNETILLRYDKIKNGEKGVKNIKVTVNDNEQKTGQFSVSE